jgi:hypothetical protein
MPASASDSSVAEGPGITNWGMRLVKKTAIVGLRRLLSRPC